MTSSTAGDRHNAVDRCVPTLAGWSFAQERTRLLADKTQELLRNADYAEKLTHQVSNLAHEAQAQGRVFEFAEALKFNLDVIDGRSSLRAVTTAELGQPHAAADIVIRSADGDTVREVQAKAYERTAKALRALANPRYTGMDRLVPSDQADEVAALAGKPLAGPAERVFGEQYEDVAQNLTSALKCEDVSSGGTSREQLRDIGRGPDEWLNERFKRSIAAEIGASAAAGAIFAGGFEFVFSSAHNALRAHRGQVEGAKAVIDTVNATAAAAVRGGAGCAVAKCVQIAARNSDHLQHFASGMGPAAVANAAVEIAIFGYLLAQGDIDASAFTERCGAVLIKNSAAWAYGAVGQTLIPVPVLGGLVGATVGYLAAGAVVEGLKLAHVLARQADAAEAALAGLEGWIYDAIEGLEEQRLIIERTNDADAEHFKAVILPLMETVEDGLSAGSHEVFVQLDALCRQFDDSLPFLTLEDFDRFMADDDSPLIL